MKRLHFLLLSFLVLGGVAWSQTTYTNIDDVTLYGGWQNPPCDALNPPTGPPYCAGGNGTPSSTSLTNGISSPSVDGASMQMSMTAPSGVLPSGQTTNVLWPYKVSANNSMLYFQKSYSIYIPSLANIQAYEDDTFQYTGTRYQFGSECDTGAYWRIWNQQLAGGTWVATTAPCQLTAGTWHNIVWNFHRDPAGTNLCSGFPCLYYDKLTVDGTVYGPFTPQPTTTSADANTIGVSFQIDQSYLGGTSPIYLDKITLTESLGTAATPTFSPAAGTYSGTQTVTLSDTTTGAILCYTTDGSTPTETANACTGTSTTYAGPITVSSSETIKALATVSGYLDSAVGSASYVITGGGTASSPSFFPAAGTYLNTQYVGMSTATSGASICWTLAPLVPSGPLVPPFGSCTTGNLYIPGSSSPITVNTTETINAIAVKSGLASSPLATAAYFITGLPAPTFSPAAGSYPSTQIVTISDAVSVAHICYTTDGTIPTEIAFSCTGTSTLYTGPISVSSSSTIQAIATYTTYADSPVASASYSLLGLIPVSATLVDGQRNVLKTSYLHWQLWNCGNNVPQLQSDPYAMVQQQFDMRANPSTGVISGQVYGNDQILCGNVASTQWVVTEYKSSGQAGGQPQYYCLKTGQTFNPAITQPCQIVPPPPGYQLVFANPIQSQTLTQPAGTEFKWAGTVDFCSASVLCGGGAGYSLDVNGGALTAGDTVNFSSTTPAAGANGINVTFQTSKSGTTDNVSGEVLGDGNAAHCLSGTGTYVACSGGGGATLQTNGVANSSQALLNFQNGTGIAASNPSGGIEQLSLTNQIAAGSCTSCNLTYNAQGQVTVAANGSGGSGITGSGTANTFPLWTGTSTQANSNLTAVTSPNGINYSVGSGLSVQLDASDLLFNSGIVGSSNVLIANTYNPGANSNAGGLVLQGAPTSGSACAGPVTIAGGQVSSSAGNASLIVSGGCANGFGAIGEDITLAGGTGAGGNGNGKIVMNDRTSTFTQSGGNAVETGSLTATKFNVSGPCASSASPAVCSSASLGFVAIPVGTNPTLVINTTTVTATSRIFLQNDATLGTALGITCNSTGSTLAVPAYVSARTGGTSFTIAYSGTVSTNSLCLSYEILN